MAKETLTGLTGSVTLPSGMNAKIESFELEETIEEKDSTGFDDNGFGTGKLTIQRFKGTIGGFTQAGDTNTDPGFGTRIENAPATFTCKTGCVITGNVNVTNIRIRAKVNEITTFTAQVSSTGSYTKTWDTGD